MAMERLSSRKRNYFRECPQQNLHDHLIIPPDHSEFSSGNQPGSFFIQNRLIEQEAHSGHRTFSNASEGLERFLLKLWEKEIPGKEHVDLYLRDQYRRNCRPSTLRNSLITIDFFLRLLKQSGKTHIEQISREDLWAFVEHEQDRGLKASTVRMRLDTLKAFIRFLIGDGIVHPEVLSKRMIIKVPDSLPRAIELDDERKLLSVIGDVRNRAMILVLLRTGMRIGELLNTLVKDVNIKEQKIDIWEAQKNRVGRVVYFSEDARGALKAWFKKRDCNKEFVIYAKGHNTMSYVAARNMFCKYLRKAGISHKGYTLHSLRHTNASSLLNAGIPLECLKELLGHTSVEMTRRYAKLTNKTREREYFKAMSKIERGEIDGYYKLDPELQEILKEKKLLS